MADNTTLDQGSGGDTLRTEDVGGVKVPVSKIYLGASGVDGGPVTTANPFPTKPVSGSLVSLLLGGNATPVSLSNPLPVSGGLGVLVGGVPIASSNPIPTSTQSGSVTALLLGGNAAPVSLSNPLPVSGSVGLLLAGSPASSGNPLFVSGGLGVLIGGVPAAAANPVPISGAVGSLVGGVPVSFANPLPVSGAIGVLMGGLPVSSSNPLQVSDAAYSPSGSDQHWAIANGGAAVLILSSSVTRGHASVFNHSAATLHLRFGTVASLPIGFDVKLTSGSYFELPKPVYLGPVYGVWDASGGFALALELSRRSG